MSKEVTFRFFVEHKIKDALLPELHSIGFRLQNLAEEMLEKKNPERDEMSLKEMVDGCIHLRAIADKLR